MKIDKIILEAIRQAVNELGSQVELATKSGLNKTHINHYLSGKVKGISLESWQKLYPNIKKYLPANYYTHSTIGTINHTFGGGVINHNINASSDLITHILESKDLSDEQKVQMIKIARQKK